MKSQLKNSRIDGVAEFIEYIVGTNRGCEVPVSRAGENITKI